MRSCFSTVPSWVFVWATRVWTTACRSCYGVLVAMRLALLLLLIGLPACETASGASFAGPDATFIDAGPIGCADKKCTEKELCRIDICDETAHAFHGCKIGTYYSCSPIPVGCTAEPTCRCLNSLSLVACRCVEPRQLSCYVY